MHQPSFDLTRFRRCTVPGLILLGIWFAGVSLGLLAARFHGESVRELALAIGALAPNFRDACVATVFPLFFSAFAVILFHRAGVWLACLVRGGSLGFLLGCLISVGGLWLGVLLLFSAVASGPMLLWFWWRRLELGLDGLQWDFFRCLLAAVALAAADTWAVAPFLATALSS